MRFHTKMNLVCRPQKKESKTTVILVPAWANEKYMLELKINKIFYLLLRQ